MTQTIDFEKLHSRDPKIKYGCAKELLKMAADNPGALKGQFKVWEEMLASDNNILRWTAIDIIGYLSVVEGEDEITKKIENFLRLLHNGNLITCNHVIFSLGLIAENKPDQRTKIIRELLLVAKDVFDTEECREIAIGKVLETLKKFPDDIKNNPDVLDFVKQAQNCKRPATQKKAIQLLNKIEKWQNE